MHTESIIAVSTIVYTFRVSLLYPQYYIHGKREKGEREREKRKRRRKKKKGGGGGEMERGGKGTYGEKDTGIDRQRL